MCQILVCNKKVPPREIFEQAAKKNDDGAGIAWMVGEEVQWKKGLDGKEVIKMALGKKIPFPFVVHFRSASIGGVDRRLTHPFPIDPLASLALEGKTPNGVLFHNGTWHAWDDKLLLSVLGGGKEFPPGIWSDARAIAYLVAHHGEGFLRVCPISGGKVAILHDGVVDMWGSFTGEDDDSWYHSAPIDSPKGYSSRDFRGKDHGGDGDWRFLREKCSICGEPTVGSFLWCNSCQTNKEMRGKKMKLLPLPRRQPLLATKVQEIYVRVKKMRVDMWGEPVPMKHPGETSAALLN